MNCFYCYQGSKKNNVLCAEDSRRIVDFAAGKLQNGSVFSVSWFGGEPLLRKSFIYETSKELLHLAEKRNSTYKGGIISNCYFLDYETALEFKKLKIEGVQVTLDGPQEKHDTVRSHFDTKSSSYMGSFNTIVNNIKSASEILDISIRVNVSSNNMYSIKELIECLAYEGVADKVKGIYFYPIFTNNGNAYNTQTQKSVYLTMKEFADFETEYIKTSLECGFKLDERVKKRSGCKAVYKNSYIIDADGKLKKCDEDVGVTGTEFGDLRNSRYKNIKNLEKWINYTPEVYAECMVCVFLPMCQSWCPHRNQINVNKEEKCPSFKYNWKEVFPLIFRNIIC
jgi:uncharacterized protein